VDLVERLGVDFLRLDWDDADTIPSDQLLADMLAAAPGAVVDVGPRHHTGDVAGGATVRTFESVPPAGIVDEPWELRRSLGRGVGHNRNERADHQLAGREIVALLTEVIAKGGHL